jgi:hypothetical protein
VQATTTTSTACQEVEINRETWNYSNTLNGRIGWQVRLDPERPATWDLNSAQVTNWNQNRHSQMIMTGDGGIPHLNFHTWLNLNRFQTIIGLLKNPNVSNAQLQQELNSILSEANNAINQSEAAIPPNISLTAANQAGLQEGAIHRITTNENRANYTRDSNRTRVEYELQCTQTTTTETTSLDDEGNETTTTTEETIDLPPVYLGWEIEGVGSGSSSFPATGWTGVEFRQLLSARCNASGIQSAASFGTRLSASSVDNQFFGAVLSNRYTSASSLPYRTQQTSGGTLATTNDISFFNSTTGCENLSNMSCTSEQILGTTSSLNRRNQNPTVIDGQSRYGVNFVDLSNRTLSSDRLQFTRGNEPNDFWVDIWRPQVSNSITNGSWRWLINSASGENTANRETRHAAHTTQIRFEGNGTPVGRISTPGNSNVDYLWRFETRDTPAWRINPISAPTPISNPLHQETISGEHTQFRTRASWASDPHLPHRMSLNWIYNGGIRTFAPTTVVGGGPGNRNI